MSTDTDTPTRTAPFFLLALGWTLALQAPAALAARGVIHAPVEALMGPVMLGVFGPILAAVVLSRRAPGGVRGLFARLRLGPVHAVWFVVVLGGFTLVYVAGVAVFKATGGTGAAWLYPPENAQHVAALVMMPIVEEVGWRGFAFPRLQQRYGAIPATVLLGAAWSAWHTMMFLATTGSPTVLAVSFVNVFVGCFVFTWIFNRTRGSLLLAILAHMGVHLNNPTHAVPNITPLFVYTVALVVVSVVLVLVDRRAFHTREPLAE